MGQCGVEGRLRVSLNTALSEGHSFTNMFRSGPGGMDDGGGGGGAGDTATLKLKGLPFSANEGDISQFFSGFALVGAYVLMDPDGRPSGMVRTPRHPTDGSRYLPRLRPPA
jgi:hypothetical protein